MFGMKPRPKRPNHIFNKIIKDIDDDMARDNTFERPQNDVYSFYYTDGRINASVPQDYLLALPLHYRRHWMYLDWDLVFPPEEPESPDNVLSIVSRESEVYQDLFKLNQEKKDKLKSIAFGELKSTDDD